MLRSFDSGSIGLQDREGAGCLDIGIWEGLRKQKSTRARDCLRSGVRHDGREMGVWK